MINQTILADAIIRQIAPGAKLVSDFPSDFDQFLAQEFLRVANMMRLPSENHSESVEQAGPIVDRIVIGQEINNVFAMGESILDWFNSAKPPLLWGWIEFGYHAYFIEPSDVCAAKVLYMFADSSGHLTPGASFNFPYQLSVDAEADELAEAINARCATAEYAQSDELSRAILQFFCLCGAICDHRFVRVDRVIRDGKSRAWKRLQARRAAKAKPVFSYNKVTLLIGNTSIERGVVRETRAFFGTRQFQRIGHWRLIDDCLEPYWTWIKPTTVGSALLGIIVKERVVKIEQIVRRGYVSPDFVGFAGQRVKAIRAQ
jgi:hypothetical protein